MHLTRIFLDHLSVSTLETIASPHKTHSFVESFFGLHPDKERPRNLWRIDWVGGECHLLIVSPAPFQENEAASKMAEIKSVESVDYAKYLGSFAEGESLRFRYKASPTMRRYQKDENGHNLKNAKGLDIRGRVSPILNQEEQKDWLLKRAPAMGVEVDPLSLRILHSDLARFSKTKNTSKVNLATAVYEGELVIRDVEKFKAILSTGYGRGKAHGCGMFSAWRITRETKRNA